MWQRWRHCCATLGAMSDDGAAGTFDGLRDRQSREWAAMTPLERLTWLDEAVTFAARTGALARRRRAAQERADSVWTGADGSGPCGHSAQVRPDPAPNW